MLAALDCKPYLEQDKDMTTSGPNDYDRARWALGWYIERERLSGRYAEKSIRGVAAQVDMSHSGYANGEKSTPDLKTLCTILNYYNTKFSRIWSICELIAEDIEREEVNQNRELEEHERVRIADQALMRVRGF